jgi:hypothetical protein
MLNQTQKDSDGFAQLFHQLRLTLDAVAMRTAESRPRMAPSS